MSSSCAAPYPCVINENYNYTVNGDSVINGVIYKRIYRKGTGYRMYYGGGPNNCSGTFSYIDTIPVHLLRSVGKKMFIHNAMNWGTEQLLYDFDLHINDTLPLTYNNDQPNVIVTSIDSILTPYGYRKQFGLSGSSLWSYLLLEGIGHEKGLVEPLNVTLECGWQLLCYGANDSAYYPTPGPTCEIPVGKTELISETKINVYPNPVSNQLTIELNSELVQRNPTLKLYNATGSLVEVISLGSDHRTIDIQHLPTGIYFLNYYDQDTEVRQKFIVSNR